MCYYATIYELKNVIYIHGSINVKVYYYDTVQEHMMMYSLISQHCSTQYSYLVDEVTQYVSPCCQYFDDWFLLPLVNL